MLCILFCFFDVIFYHLLPKQLPHRPASLYNCTLFPISNHHTFPILTAEPLTVYNYSSHSAQPLGRARRRHQLQHVTSLRALRHHVIALRLASQGPTQAICTGKPPRSPESEFKFVGLRIPIKTSLKNMFKRRFKKLIY